MGLFDKLVAVFSGGSDPKAIKLKRLRQIAKALGQNRYSKFYKPKTGELCVPLAKFFYELYRITAPAQLILRNAAKSSELKTVCVEAFLDGEVKAIGERLTAASIEEQSKAGQVQELAESVKKDLALYEAAFDSLLVTGADKCYNSIAAFIHFITFDFFFLLKKFDSGLSERNFSYQPKFHPVKGAELTEELKDFMEVAALVEAEQDWKAPLSALRQYRGGTDGASQAGVVNPDQWGKAVRLLRDVSRSGVLELIVQHAGGDPVWQSVTKPLNEKVAAAFLDAKKAEVEKALHKIQDDKRGVQIGQLAAVVFGSIKTDCMENYTDEAGKIFLEKGFDGFTKTAALGYLKAFLINFFRTEMKDLCDLFLVRGQWADTELSQQMSGGFYGMMGLVEKVPAFDNALSDTGEHGVRLKQALQKAERDKGQAKYVRIILNTVNNDAQRMINAAVSHLVVIGKNLKNLLEDHQKKPPLLIMNWKELESVSDPPITARATADLKRTYHFVQLLQFFTGPVTDET